MTDDASPENLRKFLESDDQALVLMGLSMAKGSVSEHIYEQHQIDAWHEYQSFGVPDELLPTILRLYMWDDDPIVRAAAKSTFMKIAPEDVKQAVKENWKASYRTLSISGDKFPEAVRPFLEAFKSQDDFAVVALEPLIEFFGNENVPPYTHSQPKRKNWPHWQDSVPVSISVVTAVEVLGKIGDARAVEPLIGLLKDEGDGVRRAAAEALEKISDLRAVEPLIKALGDKNVCWYAARVLGKIGDVRAVEPIIEMLGDEDYDVRKSATEALGWIGDARAIEPLIKMLSDEDSDVRSSTAHALGNIGDKRAVEPLIKALEDRSTRGIAARALGMIGDTRAVEPLIRVFRAAQARRTGYMDDGWREVTARALGEIGDARAVEPLIKALAARRGQDWTLEYALKMFGIQGLQGFITAGKGEVLTVSELKTILKEDGLPVSGTKAQLIQRLTKFKAYAKKSTEQITEKDTEKLLKSENPAMIQKGLSMVKKDGVPEELLSTILRLYMWDDDKNVRATAKSVFTKYAPAELKEKVKKNWKASYRTTSIKPKRIKGKGWNMDDKFQEIICQLLKLFTSQEDLANAVLYPLIKAFDDPDLQLAAVNRLGLTGDTRAVMPLIKALRRQDLRGAAIYALANVGDPTNSYTQTTRSHWDIDVDVAIVVDPLINLLEKEIKSSGTNGPKQDEHALDCVAALAQIGDVRAVEPLIKLLEEEPFLLPFRLNDTRESGPSIYKNPAIALGKIGDKRAVEPLITIFTKPKCNPQNLHNMISGIAEGLGEIGDTRAVEPLIEALYSGASPKTALKHRVYKNSYVRWNAIKSLGKLGDGRALEPLIKAFEEWGQASLWACDEILLALEKIVKALGETDDARVIEHLIKFHNLVHNSASTFRSYNMNGRMVYGNPIDYQVANSKDDALKFGAEALVKITEANIKGKEKKNIIKFLENDDPGTVMMGASMLKGILEE